MSSWLSFPQSPVPDDGGPPAAASSEVSPAPAAATLHFEAEKVVRAIVFHMVDEGLAAEVTGESVRRTLSRLRRDAFQLRIRRCAWAAMTNHDRLEWLLTESRTVPLMQGDEDVVVLAAKDKP